MWFFERGTSRPSLSATVTVIKDRSWPSAAIFAAVGLQHEFRRRAGRFHDVGRPFLAVLVGDDFEFAGLDKPRRPSAGDIRTGPFFLRPSDLPFRNNSAESPEV